MIRTAVESDLPAIVAIYNAAVPGRMATADTEPVSVASRRDWFAEHTAGRHPLWVDERDGEIAGWLSLGTFYNRPAWDITAEVSVYVAPAHRRQGVATSLLETAIAEAPALGLRVLIGIIFGHNDPSLALFERSGFERWAFMPRATELDETERDVVFMGRRVDGR
ncbi:MAG: GNAT family N-acetyltransferase [Chloroflexota bacterium]|nr:GNAT family N-acetyltransferase [Chloroflexota bacterium]MDE2884472.1 GNAT family N-acetyltransferase [Chloroflexota bacterium]